MPNLNLAPGSYSLAKWTTGDGANPTAGETITIGTIVFEWDGVGANVNVVIGGNLAASIDNLIAAIEANVDNVEVWREAIAAVPTLILAPYDDDGEDYAKGGAFPVLAASQALDPWVSYVGKTGGGQVAYGTIVMTANLVLAPFDVRVGFTPAGYQLQWFNVGGTCRSTVSATVATLAGGDGIRIDPTAGGVLPVATDYLVWMIFG